MYSTLWGIKIKKLLLLLTLILLSTIVSATQLIDLSRAGTTELLEENQRAAFFIEEEKYHVNIENIYAKTVKIKIDSYNMILRLNEVKKLDLNNDYIYDISVELIGVSEDNAKIIFSSVIETYSKIKQEPIIKSIEQEEITEEVEEETLEVSEEYAELTALFQTYAKYVVIGVIILIILIVVISVGSKKKPIKKAKESISNLFFEEIPKKKKSKKK